MNHPTEQDVLFVLDQERKKKEFLSLLPDVNDNLRVGFEVEMEFNKDHEPESYDCGSYHDGVRVSGLTGWKIESDGSLDELTFDNGDTCECVSKILNHESYKDALVSFYKYWSKNGKHELKEVISFNDTTGAHIHFSVLRSNIKKKLLLQHERILHELLLQEFTNNGLSEEFVQRFEKDYYRSYSKKEHTNRYDRYNSLNFSTDNSSMEWRSFHLRGITTWREFFLLYGIAIKTLDNFMRLLERTRYEIEEQVIITTTSHNETVPIGDVYVSFDGGN